MLSTCSCPVISLCSCAQPPDPVFPGFIESDERLIKELKDGERSVAQAERVLNELGSACLEAAAELEALLEVCASWGMGVTRCEFRHAGAG